MDDFAGRHAIGLNARFALSPVGDLRAWPARFGSAAPRVGPILICPFFASCLNTEGAVRIGMAICRLGHWYYRTKQEYAMIGT